jgi:hypothetical protein
MKRSWMLGVLLALMACGNDAVEPDLGMTGVRCYSGVGGPVSPCDKGLVCCEVPCVAQPDGGRCLDLPGSCEPADSCAIVIPP